MNIIAYVKTNQTTFGEVDITPVDYLVLSWVSYFDFKTVRHEWPLTLEELSNKPRFSRTLKAYKECFEPRKTVALTKALGASPRFANVKILSSDVIYGPNGALIFGAIAFRAAGKIIISYKGTGFSYSGWEEDFMLSYQPEVESHRAAREFFERVASKEKGDIVLIGHSKGGNIAVNTLFTVKDPSRIVDVYSFDGPGIGKNVVLVNPELKRKVHKYIPQSSVVGLLLETEFESKIVKSNSAFVFQHNPFSWEVRKKDFVYLTKHSQYTVDLVASLTKWIDSLSDEDKKKFTFLVFGALEGLKAKDFVEFNKTWLFQIAPLLKAYRSLEEGDKSVIKHVIKSLAKHLRRGLIIDKMKPKKKPQ